METEAKEVTIESINADTEGVVESALEDFGKEDGQPAEPSTEKETEESKETLDTGTDQTKTEESKEGELSQEQIEAKLAQVKELLGDDKEVIDAYIKEKGFHNSPAWQKLMERAKASESKEPQLSPETTEQLAELKRVTSSPEFITTKMRLDGFKEEAIQDKLKELGHEVKAPESSVEDLVVKKFNLDPAKLDQPISFEGMTSREYINDVGSVVQAIVENYLTKNLPKELDPLKQRFQEIDIQDQSRTVMSDIQGIVKEDAILDFAKDIKPELNKYLDEVEKGEKEFKPSDLTEKFRDVYRTKLVTLHKTKGKKEVRDEKRKDLRGGKEELSSTQAPQGFEQKEGESESDYIDRVLAANPPR